MKPEMDRFDEDHMLEEFFRAERAMAEAEPNLPNPAYLHWKAVEEERQAARGRAMRPIVWMERTAWLLGASVAVGLLAWTWPETGWNGNSIGQALDAITPAARWGLLGASLVALVSWLIWAEE